MEEEQVHIARYGRPTDVFLLLSSLFTFGFVIYLFLYCCISGQFWGLLITIPAIASIVGTISIYCINTWGVPVFYISHSILVIILLLSIIFTKGTPALYSLVFLVFIQLPLTHVYLKRKNDGMSAYEVMTALADYKKNKKQV